MAAKGKEEKKKPHLDFKKISKDIANADEKQHIDQIGPAITDVYIKHAKYTNSKGVVSYKSKFDKDQAEKLADDIYDALAYHSHRRIFGIDQKGYDNLASIKDEQGNRYIDVVTQHHYNVERDSLKRALASEDKNNPITAEGLQGFLEKPVKHHKNLLVGKLAEKHGLHDPEHMDKIRQAIDNIVDEFKLSKRQYNTKKMSHDQLLQTYVGLSQQHYRDE
ncbi:MAG: hypothetical protein Q8R37_04685 [Nanoarchaeota archaeon]|nr:hypothetical protein [Nanoarchaeota archaeon]